ncbi:hypothetical protein CTAYLR_009523 [Chrysophaeum taylorii]|uniref:JmjC domain-containing protein n=1 Tax=Chrysophaeum taylorii TaxID=2483200 RepID=A0AAD7XKR3_9STRA|nr:hypothetical protein CTAYLR_009523 [Chrysophaeum taylorii]
MESRCPVKTVVSGIGLVALGAWAGFVMHATAPEHAPFTTTTLVPPKPRTLNSDVIDGEDLDTAAGSRVLHEEIEDAAAIRWGDWSAGGRFVKANAKPFEAGYPGTRPLVELLRSWNPDNVTVPVPFRESLAVLNYSNPEERAMAETYRDAEVPFKVYGVPNVEEVRKKWTDSYLADAMRGHIQYKVEKSENNHFMYWQHKAGVASAYKDWVPPTKIVSGVTFREWLGWARDADADKKDAEETHHYLMLGTMPLSSLNKRRLGDKGVRAEAKKHHFVTADLDVFTPPVENFFVTNIPANKGIQCRFGMRGVIAEAHYDGGRNMVAMLKGAKRYVLAPPSSCDRLKIIPDRRHPSFRHSTTDWSDQHDAEADFMDADAIDTVVREGEVLYIPSYWIHYIVSLKYSIQCNTRSGAPPNGEGEHHVQKCVGLENTRQHPKHPTAEPGESSSKKKKRKQKRNRNA